MPSSNLYPKLPKVNDIERFSVDRFIDLCVEQQAACTKEVTTDGIPFVMRQTKPEGEEDEVCGSSRSDRRVEQSE